MSATPLITAVIPVRLSLDRLYDEPERILRIIETLPPDYVPLIVDYGTSADRAGELEQVAATTGTTLVRVESGDQPFSVGHARDIGTQHAATPLILFHDIDFLLSTRNYERVLDEARLRGMPDNAYAFFALPGVYLTEQFTRRYLALFAEGDPDFADLLLHDGVMRRDRTIYEQQTYAISAIVASRYHLLALGGHDKSFIGHGAEDFELLHRLASYAPRGPRTSDYYRNTRNNSILRYEGFRAYFALYGIDVFQRGLQIAHLWHPRRQDSSYVTPMGQNQERVSQVMADYDAGSSWIPPLQDPHSREHTLVLVKDEKAPPLKALRHAFPAFGRYAIRQERDFVDSDQLIQHMDDDGFTRVFFLNPYGNAHRLSLYQGIKRADRRFIVWDRGGLHDSWFFDAGGFLAESAFYMPKHWDRPMDEAASQRTKTWLVEHRDRQTLEKNGARIGPDTLREKLELDGRKVVFVALQRPEDTATRYFSGACENAEGFNRWIAHLAKKLDPKTHVIIAKKHPLEDREPEIPNVHFVEGDTHVMDLIDLAAVVVVINSGVGLIALSCGKPVICCGKSYYGHPGLAASASTPDELVEAVKAEILPDTEKRLRFFRYLIEDFYSFGSANYVTKTSQTGEKSRPVTRILFSSLRGLTSAPIMLGEPPGPVPLRAPLYFSFGGRDAIQEATSSIHWLLEKSKAAHANGDTAEAVRLLEIAHKRSPKNKAIFWMLVDMGKAACMIGDHSKAVELFGIAQSWAEHDKALPRIVLEEGKAALVRKDYAVAISLFELAHQWAPDDKNVYRLLLETGVERHGGPLVEMMTSSVFTLREKAREAYARRDYAEAILHFDILRLREPDKTEHLRCLAECHVRTGAKKLALKCLDEALRLSPGHKMILRRKSNIRLPRWLQPLFPGKPFPVNR